VIQLIVEGDGEVRAFPVLLERLIGAFGCYEAIGYNPFLEKRTKIVRELEFKRAVQVVSDRADTRAIIVLIDADDDCARDIIPQMTQWSQEAVPSLPCAIIMARREYEAWFLAAIESLHGKRRIRDNARYDRDPEAVRGAKGVVSRFMPQNKPYSETADQVALSADFDLGQAYRHASSFRKLVKEVCRILEELGLSPAIPEHWIIE
jgi:hypothetical protein